MAYMLHSNRTPGPLECRTLPEAMALAGHPSHADWLPYAGLPDRIVTESMAGAPAIEAIDVAHELIGLLPAGECATRVWSDADPAIACAVVTVLPSPFLVSVAVSARLSAHYAVAGILTWATIEDTVTAAFRNEGAGQAVAVAPIITALTEALAAEGIATVPPPATAAPVLRAAQWRPGIAWLSSPGAPAARIEVWPPYRRRQFPPDGRQPRREGQQ
jgi:hypothetical protein